MKPFLSPFFWSDSAVESAGPAVKLAALWLISNSQTTILGLCKASPRRFAFETGLDESALDDTLSQLDSMFKRVGDYVFVVNYIRHQFGTGEPLTRNNFFKRMASEFRSLDPLVQKSILQEYPEFEGLHKPFVRASKAQGTERKGTERTEGEECRGEVEDENFALQPDTPPASKRKPTSEAEVQAYCRSQGLPDSDGTYFWHKWVGNGFKNDAKPMNCWKSTITSWKAAGYCPSQKPKQSNYASNRYSNAADRDRDRTGIESTAGESLKRF